MSQKTRARKLRQRQGGTTKTKPVYKEQKELILENVVMSDTIKSMPVLIDHIVDELKMEVRLKHNKKRHCNLYVPEIDETEKPTGKKIKLKADITPWGIFVFEPKEYAAMKDGEKVIENKKVVEDGTKL